MKLDLRPKTLFECLLFIFIAFGIGIAVSVDNPHSIMAVVSNYSNNKQCVSCSVECTDGVLCISDSPAPKDILWIPPGENEDGTPARIWWVDEDGDDKEYIRMDKIPAYTTEYCTKIDANGLPVYWSRASIDRRDGKGFVLGEWEPPVIRFRQGKLGDVKEQTVEDIEATRPGAICSEEELK